jgi:transformation/transcription domain-associated protein
MRPGRRAAAIQERGLYAERARNGIQLMLLSVFNEGQDRYSGAAFQALLKDQRCFGRRIGGQSTLNPIESALCLLFKEQQIIRDRILAVFFKSLCHKSPEIISAANTGLKDILTQTKKLPKDLLQYSLRTILINLRDRKRLNIQGLDGLARLLTLLMNYSEVEIGAKLLKHIKMIADNSTLQKLSFGLIEQMNIVATIFNIFHLLPPAPTAFIEELVNTALNLEEKLRRTAHSPLRKPLMRHLSHYPKETWLFFQTRVQDERFARFYEQILANPENKVLRHGLTAETNSFIQISFDFKDTEQSNTAVINGIFVGVRVYSWNLY